MMSELLDDLPPAHLEYALRPHGVVGDWLVLGPLLTPLADGKNVESKALRLHLLNAYDADAEEVVPPPAERATTSMRMGEGIFVQGIWRVVHTLEDGRVDLAQRVILPQMVGAWLYAQVVLNAPLNQTLLLTTASPTVVWINGEVVYAYDELPDQLTQVAFEAELDEGTNEILIRTTTVGQGDLPLGVALQIPQAEGVVALPTLLDPVKRRQKLAAVMNHATLAQAVYSQEQRIVLRWPDDLPVIDALNARLQTPAGRIYGEANRMVQKGVKVDFGEAAQFPDGTYEVLIQPQFDEYYVQEMRVQRRIPLQIRNGKWSSVYYGSHAERRQEALEDAAKRRESIHAEIAKSALGKWDRLRHEVVEQTLARVAQRAFGYEGELLALLGWVARMGDLPDFPPELSWALEERAPLVLGHLIGESSPLLATCHLLAGQASPQRSFGDLQMGEAHQAQAEEWLLRWLRATAQMGLPSGEREATIADALVVLSHLVDLAHSDEVAEMAAAVLDKVAYQVALQSFLGAWGGSQDFARAEWLLNARLGPLCGVTRLWWGQGVWNAECAATVALACAESYVLPEIIAAVGLDRQQEAWLRRRDVLSAQESSPQVNRAAFRTGDYLLASAQGDWAAGSGGVLWQVTLGPDAVITGNVPTTSSTHNAWPQSYWHGSGAPTRVAQWRDVLLVGYSAGDASLGFSHAYFPSAMFDEMRVEGGWVLARKGNGYVAMMATSGLEVMTTGHHAHREVRAAAQSIWLVQMGRGAVDGPFAQFVERVVAQPLEITQDVLRYTSLRGQGVEFSLTKPLEDALVVDGMAQPLSGFPHIESIYGGAATLPASTVDVHYLEHQLRLDFRLPEMPSRT